MLREYLERKGIKGVIRVRRNGVGREDVEGGEYKECNEIEGLFGNMKMKLSGYVAVYREDMAMVMALVKFLFCNMYVIYFCLVFSHSYLIFLPLLPRFLKRCLEALKRLQEFARLPFLIRHIVPLAFVLFLIFGSLLSFLWKPFIYFFGSVLGLYLLLLLISSVQIALKEKSAMIFFHSIVSFLTLSCII